MTSQLGAGGFEAGTSSAERRDFFDLRRLIKNATASIAANTAAVGGLGVWQAWTPTVTQSGSVTVTNSGSRYTRIGDTVHYAVLVSVTGSGSFSNVITVSLPVTAVASGIAVGSGWIADASASGARYTGIAIAATTSTFQLAPTVGAYTTGLGVSYFNQALASGDVISVSGTYEAA